jgi:hypothetical protein
LSVRVRSQRWTCRTYAEGRPAAAAAIESVIHGDGITVVRLSDVKSPLKRESREAWFERKRPKKSIYNARKEKEKPVRVWAFGVVVGRKGRGRGSGPPQQGRITGIGEWEAEDGLPCDGGVKQRKCVSGFRHECVSSWPEYRRPSLFAAVDGKRGFEVDGGLSKASERV